MQARRSLARGYRGRASPSGFIRQGYDRPCITRHCTSRAACGARRAAPRSRRGRPQVNGTLARQRQSTITVRVPRCLVTIARTRWMESSIDGAARRARERERRPFTAARQRGRRGGVISAAPIGLKRWANKPRSSSHSIACRRTRKRSSASSASSRTKSRPIENAAA
jgi:hypothetical protein